MNTSCIFNKLKLYFIGIILFLLLATAPLQGQRYFEFVVPECNDNQKNNFIALTSDTAVISLVEDELALPERQRMLFIIGFIDHGNGGFNLDWNWHFKPDQWTLTFNSIEVCDGCPQFVENDLDYWVDVLGQFCPWGARVSREVMYTAIPDNMPVNKKQLLIKNYPNPFNPKTIISYNLQKISNVDLSIFTITGQKVAILVSGKQSAGHHEIEFNAENLPSNIYFYRIVVDSYGEVGDPARRTGEFQDVKKMILIK